MITTTATITTTTVIATTTTNWLVCGLLFGLIWCVAFVLLAAVSYVVSVSRIRDESANAVQILDEALRRRETRITLVRRVIRCRLTSSPRRIDSVDAMPDSPVRRAA